MISKKIYRYTNVELYDTIQKGSPRSLVLQAKQELTKRDLTTEQLQQIEEEYKLYKQLQEQRKHEPLTQEEWLRFFILPFFTPRQRWQNNDHFSQSEMDRFERYGYEKKAQQAQQVQLYGVLFWFVIIAIAVILFSLL